MSGENTASSLVEGVVVIATVSVLGVVLGVWPRGVWGVAFEVWLGGGAVGVGEVFGCGCSEGGAVSISEGLLHGKHGILVIVVCGLETVDKY